MRARGTEAESSFRAGGWSMARKIISLFLFWIIALGVIMFNTPYIGEQSLSPVTVIVVLVSFSVPFLALILVPYFVDEIANRIKNLRR